MPPKSSKKSIAKPKRKPVAKTNKRKPTKKTTRNKHLPIWLRNLLAVAIVIFFTATFYYFVIRPNAYRWKPCYGLKGYDVCLPYGYAVHGIDISHYQGNINWPELALNKSSKFPIRFIFMKATEGGDLDDKTFAQNFELARQYGFIRGAYHFFSPRTDVKKQVDFFIRTVKLKPGDLPPVLDVEVLGKNTHEELQEKVLYWLTHIEAHYGVKPIIYASYKFKEKHLNHPVFDAYPYWIAHYYVDTVRYTGKWYFWQHSDRGIVPGIKERVDLNVFNGSPEQLQELLID
ncbi:glycoside hydrolase family 25 protein [Bacteroides sp. OttesenSCG-928-D19]|nr:glycoside hydrolase family 25 protein [Bacteroides sp. OttesenSCG-928-N06]MDL2304579.1 glycoside hydrolase family 25 protein [Bacteroides sp. OttesenSCG-928-D19]